MRANQSHSAVSVLRHGLVRARYEIIGYFRALDSLFGTFLFPIIFLMIFAMAFSAADDISVGAGGPHVRYAAYYLPGMIASGILLSGIQNLAVTIAAEKGDGTLKRLGGTPLSPLSYFIGKFLGALATSAIQLVLLIAFARGVFGVALPTRAAAWLVMAWVYLLGFAANFLLGVALSALPRSAASASAVIVPFLVVLQFISGVYLPLMTLPGWMQDVSGIFPLRWLAQGMRSVFLPDGFAALESGEHWNLALVAAMLGGWLVIGLVIARLTFRWNHKDT